MDLNFFAGLASIAGLLFGGYSFLKQRRSEKIALAFVEAISGQASSLHEQLKKASNIANPSAFPELRVNVENATGSSKSLVNTIATYKTTLVSSRDNA